MSFILDALRKSETERQKQSAPGLADTRYKPPEKRRNIWIPLLAIVLAVNAVVISVRMMADPSEDAPAQLPDKAQEEAVAKAAAPLARSGPTGSDAEPEVRPLYREASVPKSVAAAPAPETARQKDAPAPKPKTAILREDAGGLPSIQQLSADGVLSLPALHVDIHVYAGEPAQRFVFINMNKYREGDVLKEGPRVEAITKNGAVLSHQGNRFTLERE